MKYDRDIRWMRMIVLSLIGINLAFAGRSVYSHEWMNAIAGMIWAFNCWCWLGTLSAHQRTRDRCRVTDAAIQGLMDVNR